MLFIIGSGRSGTTWLGKLFDSHPDVLYRHEPDYLHINTVIPFLPSSADVVNYKEKARIYVEQLLSSNFVRCSSVKPLFAKNYRSTFEQILFVVSISMLKHANAGLNLFNYRNLRYCDIINIKNRKRVYYVIKSVNSLCRARLFSNSCPDAKFVHVIRHPCGVIHSQLRGMRLGRMRKEVYLQSLYQAGYAQRYGFSLDYIRSQPIEAQLAFQWMVQNQKVIDDMQQNPKYKLIKYEDLCINTKTELVKLFDFAALRWNLQTEQFIDTLGKIENTTPKYFDILRLPNSALRDWTTNLTEPQIARITKIASRSSVGTLYGL